MNTPPRFRPEHESIALRIIWMLLFVLVWQVAQLVLAAVVLLQLICRLAYNAPNAGLMSFGDSLSRYLAEIGRFGSFHTECKPWPFSDWPAPRPADVDVPATAPATAPATVPATVPATAPATASTAAPTAAPVHVSPAATDTAPSTPGTVQDKEPPL
jgi:hypothetical protein